MRDVANRPTIIRAMAPQAFGPRRPAEEQPPHQRSPRRRRPDQSHQEWRFREGARLTTSLTSRTHLPRSRQATNESASYELTFARSHFILPVPTLLPTTDRSACSDVARARLAPQAVSDATTAAQMSTTAAPVTGRTPGNCTLSMISHRPHERSRSHPPHRPRFRSRRSTRPRRAHGPAVGAGADPIASRTPNSARPRAHRKRQHACYTARRQSAARSPANPEKTKAFSRSGDNTSACVSSSVAARSTG